MNFLTPITALIAAGITVPILVAMYFLKLRRRQVVVSTTLLWKKAIQDLQVNAPFQKLRRNLLLLLQLIILAALLLAFARPTLQATAQPGQRVVILIDHSGSMNATDVSPTRLDDAKRAAIELVDNLETGANAMVVSFADRPRALTRFISDPGQLRAAIRGIEPTDQPGRLAPALRIIEPESLDAQSSDGEPLAVYVLSDGRVQLPGDETLALRGAELTYVKIGNSEASGGTDNLGIVAFSARRDLEKPQSVQIFARLLNSGPKDVQTNLTLTIAGQVAQVQPVDLSGGSTRSVQFDFTAPGAAMVELRHDHADALAADDVARLMLAPAKRLRVLLVGQPNAYIERGLTAAGVREMVRMTGDKYENQDPELLRRGGWDTSSVTNASGEGFDVILFDGYSPKSVPPVSSLSFGSTPPISGLEIKPSSADEREAESVLDWSRSDPLMRYVVLDDVVLSRPGRLVLPNDAKVLATGRGGPIMAVLPGGAGTSHVVASFDVLNTNWPLYVSFPVFLSNAVQTLGLGGLADDAGVSYRTGDVAVVPVVDGAARIRYSGPMSMDKPVRGREATLDAFPLVGVYSTSDAVPIPFDRLPVNMLDEMESDLRPADVLEVGSMSAEGEARTAAIRKEIWPWFAWAALAVLLVEWIVYTRRMNL